jgi:phosphonoacetaldehyde hydrolase
MKDMEKLIRSKTHNGPIQAVVLDWAGTAVDYGCLGPVTVFIEVFKQQGVEVTVADARKFMGLMKKDHLRAMCQNESVARKWHSVYGRKPNEKDVEAMYRALQPLMTRSLIYHSDLIPGLLEAVDSFRRQSIKIGSTTGYSRSMMKVLSHEARENGYVPDSIVCSTDVAMGRPYPWMCYQNAINLQAYPLKAMVKIGDTVSDIEEGLNAGMWTIGVTKTGNELGLSEEEVSALEPDELKKRLDQIESRFRKAGAHYVVEGIWDCPDIVETISTLVARGECP